MSHERPEPKIHVARQLRPIRLAFLVPPDDSKSLRAAVEATTCLWGGIQNPIVPVYGRRPKHWEDRWEWPGGTDYAKGLLNGFEPDFVVETRTGLAARLGLPARRIIALTDVLDSHRDPHVGYGVSAIDVLRHANDEEFKFVRRRKLRAVWPVTGDVPPTLLGAVTFGAYPSDASLKYFSKWYADLFEPESLTTDAAASFDAVVSRTVTPLRASQYGLEDRPGLGWRSHEPTLFLLDPDSCSDLIDFWNLRAWGLRCLPIPVNGAKEIAASAVTVITQENVRLRGNPDPRMKHRTTLLKAPSVSKAELETVAGLLVPRPEDSLLLQDWMPRYWSAAARASDMDERGDLVATHDDIEVVVDDQHVRFDLLEPSFDLYAGFAGLPIWANTISLQDYSSIQSGLILPKDGADLQRLLRTFDRGGLQSVRSGISVVSTGSSPSQHWEIPDGRAVVGDWFAARKLAFRPSAAGRTAAEVFRALGGFHGLRTIDSIAVLKCLDAASSGSSILQHELFGLLKREHEHPAAPGNVLRSLVEKELLRLGMLLSCPACETEGWFALEELAKTFRCGRCLRPFAFPSAHPPNKKWAYRTQGSFALSGYAKGAYATLLALRCLGPNLDAEMTWYPGGEVGPESSKYELDFVAFWRKRWGRHGHTRVLMGECKTFDEFKPKEVRRFREVAKRFPETIRVFATLRPQLEQHEKKLISSLALEGRRLGGSRSPVLVLTATELLSTSKPPYCYRDAGGRFEKFKDYNVAPMMGDDGLLGLCDLTQQLHLGMEPSWTTVDREIGRRRARSQAARQRRAAGETSE